MIKIGCLARYFNLYSYEVDFAKNNGFELMQIWYDNKGISMNEMDCPYLETIRKHEFPTIVHAVLDINDFEEHILKLVEILEDLGHDELIIHPICESEDIHSDTIYKLSKKIKWALEILGEKGVTVYLENNSKLDPIFMMPEELKIVFHENSSLEFLLDLAHIQSYEHLKELVKVKKPKALHIADKHFDIIHEHLPIGYGEIDFEYIFKEILTDFQGKIILEIVRKEEDIINSKKIIERCLGI